ncbi:hypothetical protein [Allosphingosinicella indica]|nr:hypothetical protein [Allosphingosinicella indica]
MKSKGRMAAREDKRQTVALASGARVRIKSIAGAVSVQPSNSGKAEIHVARLAASQRELGCYRVDVDASPQRIDIVTVQLKDRPGCAMIEARQQVTLKLPKAADVHLSSIAGPVDIGAMDGMVQLEGIAGQTSLASARSAKISGIAGPLSVRLQRPGPWSTDISGITGTVDLAFGNGIDADVNVSGLMGRVRTLSPDIRAVGGTHQHKVRVGSGGPVLSLSGIVGTVQVRRY